MPLAELLIAKGEPLPLITAKMLMDLLMSISIGVIRAAVLAEVVNTHTNSANSIKAMLRSMFGPLPHNFSRLIFIFFFIIKGLPPLTIVHIFSMNT